MLNCNFKINSLEVVLQPHIKKNLQKICLILAVNLFPSNHLGWIGKILK